MPSVRPVPLLLGVGVALMLDCCPTLPKLTREPHDKDRWCRTSYWMLPRGQMLHNSALALPPRQRRRPSSGSYRRPKRIQNRANDAQDYQGRLFEAVAHIVLARGGSFNRRHQNGTVDMLHVPPRVEKVVSGSLGGFLQELSTRGSPEIYYRPRHLSTPVLDAALAPSELLQITRQEYHPVKLHIFTEIVEQMVGKLGELTMTWVVPHHRFGNFQMPVLRGGRSISAAEPHPTTWGEYDLTRSVNQRVMALPWSLDLARQLTIDSDEWRQFWADRPDVLEASYL